MTYKKNMYVKMGISIHVLPLKSRQQYGVGEKKEYLMKSGETDRATKRS